ncbi:MAG: hypothetical protein M3N05_03565 [Pseudomonadota bacterium]|nr:hypothetical protein [Pseudomonadota bacterium]
MKAVILAAALSLCTGGFAVAQPVEIPPGAASPGASRDDGEKIICRDEEKTGQRFKSRVCHTKTQWAALGEYGRSVAEASQQGASAHMCSGGAC